MKNAQTRGGCKSGAGTSFMNVILNRYRIYYMMTGSKGTKSFVLARKRL